MDLLLINKKPGITSFDTLRDIKRELKTGKVGHTGTLDKFASGLLIVLAGRALKLAKYFTNCGKQYIGKICFGAETDTLDPEGQVIAEAELPSRAQVESVLPQFTGNIMQAPPAYSALHIDGKRASALARAGAAPEMKPRPVTIYKLKLLSWEDVPSQKRCYAEVFVHCSSGTYIRSLARDIALASGSRGHLAELLRTQVGNFSLDMVNSVNSEQLTMSNEQLVMSNINKSVIEKLGLSIIDITSEQAQQVRFGKPLEKILCETLRPLRSPRLTSSSLALFCEDQLIAIIDWNESLPALDKKDGKWKYGAVFA